MHYPQANCPATRPGRSPLPHRWQSLLLLGLLAGAAPRLAAQELVPGTYDPSVENLYSRPVAEVYRRQRVRAVLVTQQGIDRKAEGRPVVQEIISYQEFDDQGRLTRRYLPQQGHLDYRYDLAYGPAGPGAVSSTTYQRLDSDTDTTRLGLAWRPDSHTAHAPPTAGAGIVAKWDERTGDWQPTERLRRWVSHDTTYLATTNAASGKLTSLDRTYYVGPGKRLCRQDKLLYTASGLYEVNYSYIRFDKKRVLELGELSFEPAFADYVAAHPAGPKRPGRYRPAPWQDELARHTAGQPRALATQTYDRHGLVASRTAVGIRTVYERDAHQQLQQSQHYRDTTLWQLARFAYLPNGLLARATAFDPEGQQTGALLYSYRYY